MAYVDALVLRDRDADVSGASGNYGINGSGLEERFYVMQDANWNVTGIVDTSGAVQERYQYDPYGSVTILTGAWGSRSSSSYTWTSLHQGLYYETTASLYYDRARYYSPSLFRFMQPDPMQYVDGLNWYQAYLSNPIDFTDSDGTDSKTINELKKITIVEGLGMIKDQPGLIGEIATEYPKLYKDYLEAEKLVKFIKYAYTSLETNGSKEGSEAYTSMINMVGDELLKKFIVKAATLAGASATSASLYAAVIRDAWNAGSAAGQFIAQVAEQGLVRGVLVSAQADLISKDLRPGDLKFEMGNACGDGMEVYLDFKKQIWVHEPRVYGSFEAGWRWLWGSQEYDWHPYKL